MKKTDILNKIEELGKGWTYRGDYHLIEIYEVKDMMENLDDEEYEDYDAIYDELTYDGELYEYADSATPTYYNKIAEWFCENWSAVDEYINEFGAPKEFDIMKTIQGAYCMSYERDLASAIEAIIDEVNA